MRALPGDKTLRFLPVQAVQSTPDSFKVDAGFAASDEVGGDRCVDAASGRGGLGKSLAVPDNIRNGCAERGLADRASGVAVLFL